MKIVDRIPTKIIEWQYCKSLKLRILWNSFTYHSVAPDIQILMSMMGWLDSRNPSSLTEANGHSKAETWHPQIAAWRLPHLGSYRGMGCKMLSEVGKKPSCFWMTDGAMTNRFWHQKSWSVAGHNELDTKFGMPCLGWSGKAAEGRFKGFRKFWTGMPWEIIGLHFWLVDSYRAFCRLFSLFVHCFLLFFFGEDSSCDRFVVKPLKF